MNIEAMGQAALDGDRAAVEALITRLQKAEDAIKTMYFGSGSAESIKFCAEYVVDMAITHGHVLTVEQCPIRPLAMGNYHTVVSIRPARK